ncbi:MAG: tripartite tricarboxylate transporter TctB family protein [Pseudomonadota bacterium]
MASPSDRGGDAANGPAETGAPATDIVAGLILAVLAVLALVWLVPGHVERSLSDHDVQPGFFPNLAAGVVLVLSLGLVVQRFLREGKRRSAFGQGRFVPLDLAIWVLVAGLAMLGLNTVGFLVVAPLLIAAGMLFAGCRKIWLVAAVAVLFPVLVDQAAWHVFTVDLP